MAHCVEKLPHSCGSRDGLQVFEEEGKYSGYCYVCSTYIPHPYEDKPENYKPTVRIKSPDEIRKELEEISQLRSLTLHDRKLNASTLEYFGIKVGVSEQDGQTPALHFYPYKKGNELIGYKVRIVENKKMWVVGTIKGANLFGWEQAIKTGSPRLYITEGELDAATLYQVITKRQRGTDYADRVPAVVSLVNGASSARKALADNASLIREHFKEVVLVFDNDEPGKKATEEALKAYPGARSVSLPGKDPNDCLVKGHEKALANAVMFNAQAPKNTRIVNIQDLADQAAQPAKYGLAFPWRKLTDMTRGLRFGETYYFGAGVKMGKSDLANALAAHFAVHHDLPIYMAKPEESNVMSVKKLYGKAVGKIFHDPTVEFDPEAYEEAKKLVGNRIHLLDKYQHVGWETLKTDITDAATSLGAKIVFIDPITNLTNGIDPSQSDTILKGVAQDLAAMAKDLDIAVMIFCHLKAPESGQPHERGGKVYSHQFAGSRAMMRSCNYMLGLEGNKDPDYPEEQRNLRRLVMLEDREFGTTGVIPLYWDSKTQLFNEVQD